MASAAGYYRYPTIHGDTIIFVSEDDLWRVPATGGVARRLTATPGMVATPMISPDGNHVAFAANHDGPVEIYCIDISGGDLRRVTWFGTTSRVARWTPDGSSVVVASDWRQPFLKSIHLHAVPLDGGQPQPIVVGPARTISFEPDGDGLVIGRNSGDPARWKRYRGGTAGTIWIDRTGDGNYSELVKLPGNLADPMWIADRIYFLSDHEGYGNLYSSTPTGRGLRRHTHHEDYYVRFPSTDGARIVYHKGADLAVFDTRSKTDAALDVRLHSTRAQRERKFASAPRYLESFDVHPEGHSVASVHRGKVFTMPLWEGAVARHAPGEGGRYRLPTWLHDGKHMVAVTDSSGEEELQLFHALGEGEPRSISGDFGRPIEIATTPVDPNWAVLTNQRNELILVDLDRGKWSVVDRSLYESIEGPAWSPDGRYLAYSFATSRRTRQIRICEVRTGKIHEVTRPEFRDETPAFDPLGRYLYFVSWRIFDPVYDSMYFDLGFPRGSKPFLVTLRKEEVSPFSTAHRAPRPPSMMFRNGRGHDDARRTGAPGAAAEDVPTEMTIDFEGIEDRIVAFPVPDGRYTRVQGSPTRAFFSSYPVEGSIGDNAIEDSEPKPRGVIESYDLESEKIETVAREISDFRLSARGSVMAIRAGKRLRFVPSTVSVESLSRNDKPGRESGWLDLDRISLEVVPGVEWQQMFREAWRLQRDQYWTPDMAGIDWGEVYKRYRPLVDRVASRLEFSDLMWELQGELGTSHCYELGGDYWPVPSWHLGFLGADLELDRSGRWRVQSIPRGDSWDAERSSPLAAPGLSVEVGDAILEVDGEPVGRDVSPYERLVHRAGKVVLLKVEHASGASRVGATYAGSRHVDAGANGDGRRGGKRAATPTQRIIAVKTLADEFALRYRDWVESNRKTVHERTDGRVGYLHIPNMGPMGYAEFHRYFAAEVDRQGLIVDVRWNGGGHVSQLLLEKLLRRRIGYDKPRWAEPESYPTDAPMGPIVALTNEYAGSDGDIFSHCFKLYGLGPLIGKRTWGGVIGIWPRHSLVDGTVTTQPEFSFWLEDVGWGVENYGTDPDIEVDIKPQDHAAGRDPQMERALVEVERLVRRQKPRIPALEDRPKLRPERLPAVK